MNIQTAFTTESQCSTTRVAKAHSRLGRIHPGLLASLGFAAFVLVSGPALAQVLGAAQSFAVLGGTSVTFAPPPSTINGDVGVSPGTSITGFPANATITAPFAVHNNDASAIAARASTLALYNSLAG